MRDIKLFVFDLDGTALGEHVPYHRFPESFVRFLDELADMGIGWATNTTWGLQEQLSLILNSGVKSEPAFLCGGTGRLMGRIEQGRLVPDEAYNSAVACKDREFRDEHWHTIRGICQNLLEHDAVEEIAYAEHCILSLKIRQSCADRVESLLSPLLSDGAYYKFDPRNPTGISLLPHYMNKGDILAVMRERLGISAKQIVVAGDGANDLQMFRPELAGHMICPSNACDLLKERALSCGGVVADKPCAEGVMAAMRELLGSSCEVVTGGLS